MCWTPLCANKHKKNVKKTIVLQTEHRFYAEILTGITTWNPELEDTQ